MKLLIIKTVITILLVSGYVGVAIIPVEAKSNQEELIIALTSNAIKGLDPLVDFSANSTQFIQSTLLSLNKDMEITHDLADEYQISDDKLTWEFKIRDDAYFTNGERVKASDVAFSFNTAKFNGCLDLLFLKEAVVIDDYTVHFRLKKPLSTFSYTAAKLGIVPENQYDELYPLNPIGSGPYILEDWNAGERAEFIRNEQYYGKKPSFKRVTILFMDEEEAYAAAQRGLVDVAQTSPAFANVGDIDGMDIKVLKGNDQYGIEFITIPKRLSVTDKRAGNDVTSERSIRQAINLTVDRNQIINEVLYGYGEAAYNYAEQFPWGYTDTQSEYNNIDKAKEVLNIAGWRDTDEDGVLEKEELKAKFKLQFLKSDPLAQSMSNIFKQQMKELGIEVELVGRTREEIILNKLKDPMIMRVVNHSPIDVYHRFQKSYSKEVDRLIESALANGQYEIWQRIMKQETESVPWVWLVNPGHVFFIKKGINIGEQAFQFNEQPLFLLHTIED